MKNTNWFEKIGFILILIGFVFMILNTSWENNSIPYITEKNMVFTSVGILIWAFAYMKRKANEKKGKRK